MVGSGGEMTRDDKEFAVAVGLAFILITFGVLWAVCA